MQNSKLKKQFIEMRVSGLTYNKIAQTLKVHKNTIINWAKEFKTEIDNLKAIEMESFLETLKISKSEKLKILSANLHRLHTAIEKKDFNYLPIHYLLKLQLQTLSKIKPKEYEKISFKYENPENNQKSKELDKNIVP